MSLYTLRRQAIAIAVIASASMAFAAAARSAENASVSQTSATVPPANDTPPLQPEAAKPLYLGGTGTSPNIEMVLDDLTDYLLDHKVTAKQLPKGEGNSRYQLAERVKTVGGQHLLFLSLDTGESQSDIPFRGIRLKVQCITADGMQLWEEEVSNTVWGSMPTALKALVKKMTKKLDARVGSQGLPVS